MQNLIDDFNTFLKAFFNLFTRKSFGGTDFLSYLNKPRVERTGDEAPIVDTAIVGPLLGLLGTIIGLLDAFTAMSVGGNSSGLTQGIASALWTTQLGLAITVPGWLLLSYYKKLQAREELRHAQ